jgi:glycosyltransferase involved in cell wall biosynthesis
MYIIPNMSSSNSPSVTVCIPTFNQAPFLIQAIESVLEQSYPEVCILISDDASTDDTAKLMEQYADHPRICYYRQPQNLGISANNNWLLAQPETEYIIRLDSDDLLLPEYTATLLDLFLKFPKAGYAHASVNEIDSENTLRRVRRLFGRDIYQEPSTAFKAGLTGYRVAANICMFKRSVLHEMHFYKPGMNFCEDWELSVRIANAGYGNIYYPEPLACYRVWTDQGNVRASRKLTEIRAAYELYEDTYIPLYKKRDWSIVEVEKQKTTYALNHSICLTQKNFSLDDKKQIRKELEKFTNSKSLSLKLALIDMHLSWVLHSINTSKLVAKDFIKSIYRLGKGDR